MPGNKKPSRKHGIKGESREGRRIRQFEEAKAGRRERYALKQKGIDKKNHLPLGHPLNRHAIESTFKPLEDVFADMEAGRGMLVGEDGQLYIYDPIGQEMVEFVPGILHMCRIYDWVAQVQTWGKQPPGLLALTLKLARDEKASQQDIDDARLTVQWMKDRVATITRARWTEVFEWASAQDKREQASHENV
jgi:hypothetical protein